MKTFNASQNALGLCDSQPSVGGENFLIHLSLECLDKFHSESSNKVRIYTAHAKQRARILGNFKLKHANDDSFYSGNSSQQIISAQECAKCAVVKVNFCKECY